VGGDNYCIETSEKSAGGDGMLGDGVPHVIQGTVCCPANELEDEVTILWPLSTGRKNICGEIKEATTETYIRL
jgi:hypothetical protein